MEPEQTKGKLSSIIEPLAVTVPKTSGDCWVDILGKRPPGTHSLSSVTTPRDSVNGKKSDVLLHVRDWWERFSPPEEPKFMGGRRKNIKRASHTETGT